jgi:hypothetical protein
VNICRPEDGSAKILKKLMFPGIRVEKFLNPCALKDGDTTLRISDFAISLSKRYKLERSDPTFVLPESQDCIADNKVLLSGVSPTMLRSGTYTCLCLILFDSFARILHRSKPVSMNNGVVAMQRGIMACRSAEYCHRRAHTSWANSIIHRLDCKTQKCITIQIWQFCFEFVVRNAKWLMRTLDLT